MTTTTHALGDLERKVGAGEALSAAELARVLACPDLVSVGVLGEMARRRATGDTITFGRVAVSESESSALEIGDAGEVRLAGRPSSLEAARARVRAAVAVASGVPLTGFSLIDLVDLCGHDHLALADASASLRADGLEAVAETPVDRFESAEALVEALRAVVHGGLAAPRFTVDRATLADRLALMERVADVQATLGNGRAFAPLPRFDPVDTPSTGYDDVKTIALARLRCPASLLIQVDWPLYGPKLAQVALAYGAGDVDGVAAVDRSNLGPRRSPAEDIARQIRAAGGTAVERDGRFARRG
jgi:aminodeoxyfutalosine synthase